MVIKQINYTSNQQSNETVCEKFHYMNYELHIALKFNIVLPLNQQKCLRLLLCVTINKTIAILRTGLYLLKFNECH